MSFVSRLRVRVVNQGPKNPSDLTAWGTQRDEERQHLLRAVLSIIPAPVARELKRVLKKDATLQRFSGEDDVALCDALGVRWYVYPSELDLGYVIELAGLGELWTVQKAKAMEGLLMLNGLPKDAEVYARLVDSSGCEDRVAEAKQSASLIVGEHWSSGLV